LAFHDGSVSTVQQLWHILSWSSARPGDIDFSPPDLKTIADYVCHKESVQEFTPD